jgi:hypothetical protein
MQWLPLHRQIAKERIEASESIINLRLRSFAFSATRELCWRDLSAPFRVLRHKGFTLNLRETVD